MPSAPPSVATQRPPVKAVVVPARLSRQRKLIGLAASLIAVVVTTTALLIALPDDPGATGQHGATATPHVVITAKPLGPVTQAAPTPGQWGAFALSFAQTVARAPSDPATIYACGSLGRGDHTVAFGVSHDGGANWDTSSTTITGSSCLLRVAPGDSHTLALLAATCATECGPASQATAYISHDSGATWAEAFLPDGVKFSFVAAWAGTTLFTGTMATAHPIAASAGDAFTFADDCLRYIGDPATTLQALFGANGTIYATLQAATTSAATPTAPSAPLVIQSANGGAVWSLLAPHDGLQTVTVFTAAADGSVIFGQEGNSMLVTSIDGGLTWRATPGLPDGAAFTGYADRLGDGSVMVAMQGFTPGHITLFRGAPGATVAGLTVQLPGGAQPILADWNAHTGRLAIWALGAQGISVYFA